MAVTLPDSVRCVTPQKKSFSKVVTQNDKVVSSEVVLRWDDTLGNGKNSFSLICHQKETSIGHPRWTQESTGASPELLESYFPELLAYLPYRGMFADGPLYYLKNTLFLAGTKDCFGGESGVQRKTKDGVLRWKLPVTPFYFVDSNKKPAPYINEFEPVLSEGKSRELSRAQAILGVGPVSEDELLLEPETLEELLRKKYPELPEITIKNAVYCAGDRDYHGLRAGEHRRYAEGLMWQQKSRPFSIRYADEQPDAEIVEYVPVLGDGKERELDVARHSAVWLGASDEELMLPEDQLAERLVARLPALMYKFKEDIEKLGFVY